ncbi:MAG: type II toxin-antitoxin system prevent-host-death family antitoxin [Coriobacteriia bacterium]|nr:type II toxin-antitoxin system prevent-host-death family antitoxin [Coriobacteriia bacterium]
MTVCVPIKDLKDTTTFAETVASARGPVIVTRNGKDAFVSMSIEEYESMKLEAARSRLYQAMDRAESDFAEGRVHDASETVASLEARYGV